MAVSVRMEALLERQLELAAQRRGISKSQFIIEAVESALGQKDPGQLLLQVREEFAPTRAAETAAGGALWPPGSHAERLRAVLRERHDADLHDWAARTDAAKLTASQTIAAAADKPARAAPAKGVAKRRGRAA